MFSAGIMRGLLKKKAFQVAPEDKEGKISGKDELMTSLKLKGIEYDTWKVQVKKTLKTRAHQNISTYPKRQQLYYIYKTIMNRRTFEYSLRHLMKYFLFCRQLKSNDKMKKGPSKRDMFLNRAIVKLKEDMSIMKLLSRAQIVEEMLGILFNKSDWLLM